MRSIRLDLLCFACITNFHDFIFSYAHGWDLLLERSQIMNLAIGFLYPELRSQLSIQ